MNCPTSETLQSPLLQHFPRKQTLNSQLLRNYPRNSNYHGQRCYCTTHMTNVNWAPGAVIKPHFFKTSDKDKQDFNTQSALLVDLVGFIFFSIFMMFEFWIRVTYYAVRCINALQTADGIIQIAAAASSLFILCSIAIQTILSGGLREVQGRCY